MSISKKRKVIKSLTGLFNEAALQQLGAQPETINDHLNRYFRSMQMASSPARSTPMTQKFKKSESAKDSSSLKPRRDSVPFAKQTEVGAADEARPSQPSPAGKTKRIKSQTLCSNNLDTYMPDTDDGPSKQPGTDASLIPPNSQEQAVKPRKRPTARKTIKKSAKALEQINRLQKIKNLEDKHNDVRQSQEPVKPIEKNTVESLPSHLETVANESLTPEVNESTNSNGALQQSQLETNTAHGSMDPLHRTDNKQNKTNKKSKNKTLVKSLQREAQQFIVNPEYGLGEHSINLLDENRRLLRKDSLSHPTTSDESIVPKANKLQPEIKKHEQSMPSAKNADKRTLDTFNKAGKKSSNKQNSKRSNSQEMQVSNPKKQKHTAKKVRHLDNKTRKIRKSAVLVDEQEANPTTSPESSTDMSLTKTKHNTLSKTSRQYDHTTFVKRQIAMVREPLMFCGNLQRSFEKNMAGKKRQVKTSVVEGVIKRYNRLLLRHGHVRSPAVDDLTVQAVRVLKKDAGVQFHDNYWKAASRDLNFTFPDEIPEAYAVNKTQFHRYNQLAESISETRRCSEPKHERIKQLVLLLYDLDALKKVGDKIRQETPNSRTEAELRAAKFRTALTDAKRVLQCLDKLKT